jgi:hypothetical protein
MHKFVVYAPDSTDLGTLARRYEVRERHLEAARPLIDNGTFGIVKSPSCVVICLIMGFRSCGWDDGLTQVFGSDCGRGEA